MSALQCLKSALKEATGAGQGHYSEAVATGRAARSSPIPLKGRAAAKFTPVVNSRERNAAPRDVICYICRTYTSHPAANHGFFSVCVSRPKGAKKPVCPGRRGGKGEKGKEGGEKEKGWRLACGSVDYV